MLEGKTVKEVRNMTSAELEEQGWDYGSAVIITFDDGTKIFASKDEEGNGPGSMFGIDSDKKGFFLMPD